ncbi:TspO/MBR family protein [Nocardiopsis sp. CNT-189]|uniref:TspO/MBR family protein n=1 Tax=Nocardiopsis oceanisediminis TaxID=2816862 RepID=UPI003B3A568C
MSETERPPRAAGAPALAGLGVFAAAVIAAALAGALSSTTAAQDYMRLEQPAWAPPSWVFGPVWTVLYAAIAVAGWNVWRLRGWSGARTALSLYAVQLVLNAAWTPLFFAAGLRGTALVDIVLLLAVLTAAVPAFFRVSAVSGALLVPYWFWVAFAAALNLAVWRLNA